MNIKRLLLLAGLTLTLAAFATPPGVSALEFKDAETGEGASGQELTGTGTLKFSALGSGIECAWHPKVKFTFLSVHIKLTETTTSSCVSFGVPYSNCEIETDVSTLPWTAALSEDATGPLSTISSGTMDETLKSKAGKTCFTSQNDLTLSDVILRGLKSGGGTAATGQAITGFELSGTVKVDSSLGENTAAISGTFELTSGSGTFKIE